MAGSATGSIYLGVKCTDLAAGLGVIFQTGDGNAGQIRIALNDDQLVARVLSDIGQVNSKAVTIPNTDWVFLAFTFDSAQVIPQAQTALKLNNAVVGESVDTDTVLGMSFGNDIPYFGFDDMGANPFTGSGRLCYVRNVVDDAAAQTAMFNYFTYLNSLSP